LFSAVAIGYSLAQPQLHVVCPNQYRGMRTAVAELGARGYRRPGLVMSRASDERVENNWSAGFLTAQRRLRAVDRVPPLLLDEWSDAHFEAWMARHKPDVLIAKFEEVPAALRRLGREVPRDVGLAFLTWAEPGGKRSGIHENPAKVGAAAVEYLTTLLHHNERGIPAAPQQLLVETTWVEGRQLRGLPRAVKTATANAGRPGAGRATLGRLSK
jgi:DNA-binding LacI/PurR family transcriptional regulator